MAASPLSSSFVVAFDIHPNVIHHINTSNGRLIVAYQLLGYMTDQGQQTWDSTFKGVTGRNEVSEEIVLEYTGREDEGRYEITVPIGAELVARPHSKPNFSLYSELSGTRIVADMTWPGGELAVRSNGMLVYRGFGQAIRLADE